MTAPGPGPPGSRLIFRGAICQRRGAASRPRPPPDAPPAAPVNGNGKPPPPAWTVDEACAELAEQYGCHISPRHLRLVLRGLPGLPAVAEQPPGPYGGRGAKLYPCPALQVLGDFLIKRGWLQSDPLTPEQARDRKRGTGRQAERATRRR